MQAEWLPSGFGRFLSKESSVGVHWIARWEGEFWRREYFLSRELNHDFSVTFGAENATTVSFYTNKQTNKETTN